MTYLKIEVCIEHFATHLALEPFDSSMHLDMLVEVSPLREAKLAVGEGAHVGSLIRVNAQVIKKVVPLPEPLVAIFVVALEHLDVPLRFRVLVGEDPILLGIRHMFLDLD